MAERKARSMGEIWISRLNYVLGEDEHDLRECQDHLVSPVDELIKAGFAKHHVCSGEQTSLDLAQAVVKQATAERPVDPELLVYATALPLNAAVPRGDSFDQTGDVKHLMDFPGSHIQADAGWTKASVFGLGQQACTTVMGSWRLAGAMLGAEPDWKEAVCINADRFPQGAAYEQSYNPISDAATFTRVSREPEVGAYKVRAIHQITNGALSLANDTETAGSFFPWMHQAVQQTLVKAKVSKVDWIVPQNTHSAAWTVLTRLLQMTDTPVHEPTRESVAHMISGDNIANLIDLDAQGMIKEGDTVLMTAAGYGANWQCAVLEVGPR